MRTGSLLAAAVAGTVAVLSIGSAPSFAAAKHRPMARPMQVSMLSLSYAPGEKAAPAQKRATLTCNPAGGTVTQAKQACADITTAKGDLSKLPIADGMCMMLYDPVTVSATGRWKGKTVKYTKTYGNACVLKNETGAVFQF
jgi:hypothetical protein